MSRTARQAVGDMKREPGNERGSGRGTKAKGIAARCAKRGERRAIPEASIMRIVQCQEARQACNPKCGQSLLDTDEYACALTHWWPPEDFYCEVALRCIELARMVDWAIETRQANTRSVAS